MIFLNCPDLIKKQFYLCKNVHVEKGNFKNKHKERRSWVSFEKVNYIVGINKEWFELFQIWIKKKDQVLTLILHVEYVLYMT